MLLDPIVVLLHLRLRVEYDFWKKKKCVNGKLSLISNSKKLLLGFARQTFYVM